MRRVFLLVAVLPFAFSASYVVALANNTDERCQEEPDDEGCGASGPPYVPPPRPPCTFPCYDPSIDLSYCKDPAFDNYNPWADYCDFAT